MATYQAVETPWNTQLSTLSTQDAAFSTIGSDLSDLSSAMTALTNFQGVLESEEGSSSDPNVLALTAASTSARPGAIHVTVTQLAQSDSWTHRHASVRRSILCGGKLFHRGGLGNCDRRLMLDK